MIGKTHPRTERKTGKTPKWPRREQKNGAEGEAGAFQEPRTSPNASDHISSWEAQGDRFRSGVHPRAVKKVNAVTGKVVLG